MAVGPLSPHSWQSIASRRPILGALPPLRRPHVGSEAGGVGSVSVILFGHHFHRSVTFANLSLIKLPAFQCLSQRKKMFFLPCVQQRLTNSTGFSVESVFAQRQQGHRVAFAIQDGSNDPQSAHAPQVAAVLSTPGRRGRCSNITT